MQDQQKFIDQLKNSKYPEMAEKGYGYFIIWADGRAKVGYKYLQDAIDFINQNPDNDPYGMDVVQVKYREAEKGERVRNKFTEASARTYRMMKKAWDNPVLQLTQKGQEAYTNLAATLPKLFEPDAFDPDDYPFGTFDPDAIAMLSPLGESLNVEVDPEAAREAAEQYELSEEDLLHTVLQLITEYNFTLASFREYLENETLVPDALIERIVIAVENARTDGLIALTPERLPMSEEEFDLPRNIPEGIARKLNMKKAWDNPPRDDATYPGSNVSGPVPHSVPKSPGSKPRRDQRTIEDYHAPSQLDRDPVPGDTQPEQGTDGQPHSGDLDKVDNIYPEPLNWLRPLKGLPFTDEHIIHDFNEDFDTEYYIRQRGLNMRRMKKGVTAYHIVLEFESNMQEYYAREYENMRTMAEQAAQAGEESPFTKQEGEMHWADFPVEDIPMDTGMPTVDKVLDALNKAVAVSPLKMTPVDQYNMFRVNYKVTEDSAKGTFEDISKTLSSMGIINYDMRIYNYEGPNKWNDVTNSVMIGDVPTLPANIPEGIASKLDMKKQSSDPLDEIGRMTALWQQTAEIVGVDEVLDIFSDRTKAYELVMGDLRGRYPEDVARTIAVGVVDAVPQALQVQSNKLNMKKEAEVNPQYDYGTVQTSDVSDTVIDTIKNIQESIDKDKLHDGEDEPGWVENGIQKLFHITVLFGVNDDVENEIKKVFDKYKPVRIETAGIEYFSSDPNYDVAIVRCKSEELTKIHDELKDILENKETYPNYKPHITIAYLKKGERLDDDVQITDTSWEVDSLDLSTTDGRLEKISALAVPIRESLDYPHSWRKKKKKKEVVPEKEKKILQMDSNKVNLKKASILDEPRASLDSAIWDIGRDDLPMLKPDVKVHIVENFLSYIAKFGGYIRPEEFVKNMFYTGSTATYTYADASDIDIHVIVDWIDLAALNPDKARKDPKEMWQELHDVFWWTLNKIKLPGTKHPLTYYVVPPGDEKKLVDQKEEIYDIGHDVWLIPPGEVIALPQEAMSIATEEASEIMLRIEEHLANARKGIIDYDMLKILEKLNNGNTPIILQKFDEVLKVLDKELVALKDEYALLKQKRQEGFDLGKSIAPTESKNYTLGNIIFKLVERYKLMDVLREIKRITDAKPIEHGQVDAVTDALGFEDE